MEDFPKIIRIVFLDNIAILIFMSLSWLVIYVSLRIVEAAAGKVLLRLPYFFSVRFWRLGNGIPSVRKMILDLKPISDVSVKKGLSQIGKYISHIDNELSRIVAAKFWIPAFVLRNRIFEKETRNIFKSDVALLEGDQVFYLILSDDASVVTRGLLYAVGSALLNPVETVSVLLHVLKFGPLETRDFTLSLAKLNISTEAELRQLEQIVSMWHSELRKRGEQAAADIEERLMSQGIISRAFSARASKS